MNQPDQHFSSIQLQLLQQLHITPLQIRPDQASAFVADVAAAQVIAAENAAVVAAASVSANAGSAPQPTGPDPAPAVSWQSADPAKPLVQDLVNALQYLGLPAHWQVNQQTDTALQLTSAGLQSRAPDAFSSAQAKKALWQWLCAQEVLP